MVVPLALLVALASVAGYAWYRTNDALDRVHSVSTPPPEVSGAALGGDEGFTIDTGPAQEALRQQQANQGNATQSANNPVLAPTEPPATEAGQLALQPSSEPDKTSATDPPTPVSTTPAGNGRATETTTLARTGTSEPAATASSELDLAFAPASTPGVESGGINILLMGVDARPGEAIDIGVRSDSLGVLHLDPETGSCRILAVPRDSRVDMPGYGMTKINHALAVGGIPFQQLIVEQYLDIEIDHYGLVDFAALTQVVDALGGITVDNPEAFDMGEEHFGAGLIELDGERALLYSRYRGGADGDFGRVEKQQQVIKAIMDELTNANLIRLVPDMFGLLSDHIRTDFGITDSIDLANAYRDSCTSTTLETHTIPGDVQTLPDDMMGMDLSFVVSEPEAVRKEVDWLLNGD